MNEREHVLNAVLLGLGVAYLLEPGWDTATWDATWTITVPVLLGALFPDVDGHFGSHRKTFHNLSVLGLFAAFPVVYGNLHWVWLGVASHYVLDVLGTTRGIALFYPVSAEEFEAPVGVPVSSKLAPFVMLAVTAFELAVAAAIVRGPWDVAAEIPLPA